MIANADRNVPEIGGEADLDSLRVEGKADGVGGVVRDGEGHDLDIANVKAAAGRKNLEPGKLRRFSRRVADRAGPSLMRSAGHENWNIEFLGESGQTIDMIAMFMRNDDRRKRVGIFAGRFHAFECLAARDTSIDQ